MKMREKKNQKQIKKIQPKATPKLFLINPKTGEFRYLEPNEPFLLSEIENKDPSFETDWDAKDIKEIQEFITWMIILTVGWGFGLYQLTKYLIN